ncbi:MAG: hypothetical protein ACR2RF_06300, partial [Geminicoccaceae bacterium]
VSMVSSRGLPVQHLVTNGRPENSRACPLPRQEVNVEIASIMNKGANLTGLLVWKEWRRRRIMTITRSGEKLTQILRALKLGF